MDAIISDLVAEVVAKYETMRLTPLTRLVVGIAGLPGSGKSTVAVPLTAGINAAFGTPVARCVSLDGWHLPRTALDQFPDPVEAHFRRGAPFTFDVVDYARFVDDLKTNFTSSIAFPTFEHVIKDPVPSDKPIQPSERIVVIEGLYTLLGHGQWKAIAERLDRSVYVHIDREVARSRCIERNWANRLTATKEETIKRVDESDMANGDLVRDMSIKPSRVLTVVDDPKYAPVTVSQ